MDSESTDLQRTQKGDSDAFARLLCQYSPLISAIVSEFSKACPSVDMSEDDLRQEAAIALYLATTSYKADRDVSFGLYAKICIKNRLRTYMQRCLSRSISQIISDCIDDCFEDVPASSDEEPLNVIISNESYEELRQTIKKQLTEYEYRVFIMTSDGISPAGIAEKLGKSVRSVYGTVQRIRKKLKKLIQ